MNKTKLKNKLEQIGSWVIFAVMLGVILFECSRDVSAAEYRFSPPPPPEVVLDVEVKINGIPVSLTGSKCPEIPKTDLEPVDFTACPKGYKCSPRADNGMRTLRIDEEDRYKKIMEEWSKEKSLMPKGARRE